MRENNDVTIRCHRWWMGKGKGRGGLCTLRAGHGGTYCIDTVNNTSRPTDDTQPSQRERLATSRWLTKFSS